MPCDAADAANAAVPVTGSRRSRPPKPHALPSVATSGRSDPAVTACVRACVRPGVAGRAAKAYRVVLRTPWSGTRRNSQGFSWSRQVAIGGKLGNQSASAVTSTLRARCLLAFEPNQMPQFGGRGRGVLFRLTVRSSQCEYAAENPFVVSLSLTFPGCTARFRKAEPKLELPGPSRIGERHPEDSEA
ncbi:uncharacterized protein LY79DRAFT_355914 [Colletotrichum navitas]|uniref:Uncharacterized protein n=1 Tax=Colletotrichum navitas TaxID=681940 RepID=A0AAD8VA03_9PEZI|nr:uncharacterized protein LY79DRAFT_355914 [Colletotrichum navitas]KAK1597768.1 hypothetical protein LY79DRAFT_355914 [Colletotrichum navitas]